MGNVNESYPREWEEQAECREPGCEEVVTRSAWRDSDGVTTVQPAWCDGHRPPEQDPFLISEQSFPFNPQLPPPTFG
jgi:hypothetical protein